jgi:hypothetical protein
MRRRDRARRAEGNNAQRRILAWASLASAPFLIAAVPKSELGTALRPAAAAEVDRTILHGPWSARRPADNACPKIYMLDSRTCPFCQAFMRQHFDALDRSGYDLRVHYAPVVGENIGALGEIALRRDIDVTMRHHHGQRMARGPDPSATGGARLAAFNSMVEATKTFVKTSRAAGYPAYLPSFVWQDRRGNWRIHSGYTAQTTPMLLASLPPPAPMCKG